MEILQSKVANEVASTDGAPITKDVPNVLHELSQIEKLRGSRVLLYIAEDRAPFQKAIEDEDFLLFYHCMKEIGSQTHLDVICNTYGGNVSVARRILLLLREYASRVDLLVPYKARSAGTLLCLGANSIVMTPFAELSPIDPQIGNTNSIPSTIPARISSEDIRAFRQMAEHWFGMQGEEHAPQILHELCERIFPASLTGFFRADQLMRTLANELLAYQLPDVSEEGRQKIVNELISGFHAHDYAITRSEAQLLGLHVLPTSKEEEGLLWGILSKCRDYLTRPSSPLGPPHIAGRIDALIMSTSFCARHFATLPIHLPADGLNKGVHTMQILQATSQAHWEVL